MVTESQQAGLGGEKVRRGARFGKRLRLAGGVVRGFLIGAMYPLVSISVMVAIWKFVQVGLDTKTYLLPSPELVTENVYDHRSLLIDHTWVTLKEVLMGFGLAGAVAIPLAVVMASWKPVERFLYPPLVASQGIPKSALAPIFVIWLGFGVLPKVIIAMLIAFFPIVVATFVGLRSIKPEMIDLGRVMGLSWLAMLLKIRFPNALPSVFGGLKVGITLAVVGAIVGEFVAAEAGLGYLLILTTGQLRTELMFAALMYLAAMGIILFSIVDLVEKLAIPWYHQRNEEAGGVVAGGGG